jgi:Zn-dependent protease with chaperone function
MVQHLQLNRALMTLRRTLRGNPIPRGEPSPQRTNETLVMTPDDRPHTIKPCPDCSGSMPVYEAFPTWCEGCGWNLSSPEDEEMEGPLARYYRRLGRNHARRLFETYANAPASHLRPRLTLPTLAAWIITVGVHLTSLLVAALGLLLMMTQWPKVMPMALGGILMAFAWLLRPRLSRPPDKTLDAEAFPTLFNLVHEICQALGVQKIRHIQVDEEFNASVYGVGWRQEPVLTIGLPLWMTLSPPQQVALLAHEISHCANGDPARGFVTFTALHTLDEWRRALVQEIGGDGGLPEFIAELLMKSLALMVNLVIWMLSHLIWRESQKAEYLADYIATTACGTMAMVELLDSFRISAGYLDRFLLTNVFSSSQSGVAMLSRFCKVLDSLPESERERMRRLDAMIEGRLDATHPPTHLRMAFLERHPIDAARILLDDERAAAIQHELRMLEEPMGKKWAHLT